MFVIRSLGVACLRLWFGRGFLPNPWDVCLFFKLRFSSNSLIARALKKKKKCYKTCGVKSQQFGGSVGPQTGVLIQIA